MTTTTSIDFARVRDTVHGLMDNHHLPGLAVGVVSGDDLVYAEGFGLANIESGTPMTPQHRQRIGSITKTMVGLCAMALVDERRLHLDDRVVDLLPDVSFIGPAETMTVWHLLTHTSGIGEAPQVKDLVDPNFGLWMDEPGFPGVPAAYPDGITLEVPAGTKWAYANHGFGLLGEIVSRLEGAQIKEVVHRRIFEPLGMSDTDLEDKLHQQLSTGYHRPPSEDMRDLLSRIGREPPDEKSVDGHNIRGRYQYVSPPAAGAVQSTIPDMALYASALLRKSAGIVAPDTFEMMVAPQWCPDRRLQHWGLSFELRSFSGRSSFGHGGGVIGGWNSHLSVFPDVDLAVLIHTNIMYENFDTVVLPNIHRAVLRVPPGALPRVPVETAFLASAPGVYEAPTPGPLTNFRIMTGCGRVQIAARDGSLYLRSRRGPWKQWVHMIPTEPDLFLLETKDPEPPLIGVILDAGGRCTGLRLPRLAEMRRNREIEPW